MIRIHPATVNSFIRACKSLREFKPNKYAQEIFEPTKFEALLEFTATLEVLGLFSHRWHTVRAIDNSLARFKKLARLEVSFSHLVDYGKMKQDGALTGGKGPCPP